MTAGTYDDTAAEVLSDLEGPFGDDKPEEPLATSKDGEEGTEKRGDKDDEDGGNPETGPSMRVVGGAAIVPVIISGVQSVGTHGC